jgi:formamidopyrimidine-DNA glycosylase
MPELPEVETIRRELKPKITNQRITDCLILRKDIIAHPGPRKFCSSISNERIIDVKRRAKYLILELTNNKRVIFHLRLSGTVIIRNLTSTPEKYTRVVIKFNHCQLFFKEPRALGRVYLVEDNERPNVLKGFFSLGHEPISKEFDFQYFRNKIRKRRARIKLLLLDQHICAGVGNIYSDEALFRAGIRPLRRANRINTKETFRLILALRDVLNKAIKKFGTSVSDYKRTNGKDGSFQNFLHVYSREDEPCRVCGTIIVLKKIGNRSTRYCPRCQK